MATTIYGPPSFHVNEACSLIVTWVQGAADTTAQCRCVSRPQRNGAMCLQTSCTLKWNNWASIRNFKFQPALTVTFLSENGDFSYAHERVYLAPNLEFPQSSFLDLRGLNGTEQTDRWKDGPAAAFRHMHIGRGPHKNTFGTDNNIQ